jgi:hypothetical protein
MDYGGEEIEDTHPLICHLCEVHMLDPYGRDSSPVTLSRPLWWSVPGEPPSGKRPARRGFSGLAEEEGSKRSIRQMSSPCRLLGRAPRPRYDTDRSSVKRTRG